MRSFNLEYQTAFVNLIQTHSSQESRDIVYSLLEERWIPRIAVYQHSFLARAIGVLANHHLSVLLKIFGESCVHHILLDYYQKFPAKSSDMLASLSQLPQFVLGLGDEPENCLFAALAEASLAVNALLSGPDPDPKAMRLERFVHLMPKFVRFIKPKNAVQVYEAWMQMGLGAQHNFIGNESGLLIIKTSVFDLSCLRVAPDFYPLLENLMDGMDLISSLGSLSDDEVEKIERSELYGFLRQI